MTDIERNLTVFEGHCLPHGHEFEAYDFSDFQYGERIIRAVDGEKFGLMTIDDEVVNEVENILADICSGSTDGIELARLFDLVFGLSCDPIDGEELDASIGITCAICKTLKVDYRDSRPPRYKRFVIPQVTHERWRKLPTVERRNLIAEGLRTKGELA